MKKLYPTLYVYKIYIEVLKFGDFNFDEFSIITKIDQNYNPAKKKPQAMRYRMLQFESKCARTLMKSNTICLVYKTDLLVNIRD